MDKRAVRTLVRSMQSRMGLSHWQVEVFFDSEAAEGSEAVTFWSHDYDRAGIHFPPDEWREMDDYRMLQLVIHELGHLVTRELEMVAEAARESMPADAYVQWKERYRHALEGTVDRYASFAATEISR